MINAEGGMSGTFANVTDFGAYVSVNGNGLTYDEGAGTVTLTLDKNLNPADGNVDGKTDVRDLMAWNANRFTFDTAFTDADYNGDGKTDVRDLMVWNSNRFTFATGPGGAPIPAAVPEPATMALLGLGGMVMMARRRRRK